MKMKPFLTHNQDIVMMLLGTIMLMMIPLVATLVSTQNNWGVEDFVVMAFLLLTSGSLVVIVNRKVKNVKHRFIAGIIIIMALVFIWAELAVGILW